MVRPLTEAEIVDARSLFPGETLRDEVGRSALLSKDAVIVGAFSDRLRGVASYRIGERDVKLISIASLQNGCGRAMVEYIRSKTGLPLWCKGVESASGFYESVGMKRGDPVAVGSRNAHLYTDLS